MVFTSMPRWFEATGGILGACYMITAVYVTQTVGVQFFFSLVVVGQLSSSVLLDHLGFVGLPVKRADGVKGFAVLLALCGEQITFYNLGRVKHGLMRVVDYRCVGFGFGWRGRRIARRRVPSNDH
jgi:uncharacterized membrane protein YdcZ (DUF606 family)